MADDGTFGIGELAERAGVSASALRYWEAERLLPAPRRVSGRRRYGAETLERIELLRLCQDAGFSLDQIRAVVVAVDSPTDKRRALLRARIADAERVASRAGQLAKRLERVVRGTEDPPDDDGSWRTW